MSRLFVPLPPRWEFRVVNSKTKQMVEYWHTPERANKAKDALNEHEVRCGREPIYIVEALSFTRQ